MARKRAGTTADISLLQPIIETVARGLHKLSSPGHPDAKTLYDGLAVIVEEDLLTYSKQLAHGDTARAKSTLETIGQKLTTLAIATASKLDLPITEDEASAVNNDKLYNDTAETLSLEIEKGLKLYQQLKDIYQQLDDLRQKVTRAANQWSLSDDDPVVKAHLEWFSDDAGGFNTRVSNYFIDPSLEQEATMREVCNEARQRLDVLRSMIDRAETTRHTMREVALPVLNLPASAVQLLRQLQKICEPIQLLPKETVDEVVNSSELLTTEELALWRHYEGHAYFGNPDRMRTDFADQAERIRRRLDDAPRLSEAALTTISNAQRYVGLLSNRLEVMTSPTTVTLPRNPPVQRNPQVATLTSEPSPPTRDERLDEIYQLAIIVASYKYCSPRHVVGMTVSSVLSILAFLGKITESEKVRYREALDKRLRSRSVKVTDNRKVHSLWRETSPQNYDWIYFKPKSGGSLWLWRLVSKAQAPGQAIARQLGITQEAVEKAFEDHKEAQQARRLERKKED